MIIVASGHDGVDRYVNERMNRNEVMVAKHWNEVLAQSGPLDAVFIGRDLPGLPEAALAKKALGAVETVVWVSEDDAQTWRGETVKDWVVWSGGLDQDQLDEWLDRPRPRPAQIEKKWAVSAVSGRLIRDAMVGWLVEKSRAQFGSGMLVDLDWNDAQTTWHSPWGRPGSYALGYEHLSAVRMPYGVFVPAPAPWMMLLARPGSEEMKRISTHNPNRWMGFDMGVDFRNPLWSQVAYEIDRLYLLCPGHSWTKPLSDLLAMLADLRSDLPITLCGQAGANIGWLEPFNQPPHQLALISQDKGLIDFSNKRPLIERKERHSWPIFTTTGIRKREPRNGPKPPKKR